MLQEDSVVLVVVDVQGKLARVVHESERVIGNVGRIIAGAKALGVPVLCTEQNPAGLGATVEEIAPLLGDPAIPKMAFSCCGEPVFVEALKYLGRRQILLAGVETHVCVYQTAMDLLQMGLEPHVVADAVSSRDPRNKELALRKMRAAGAMITCVEMALFELLGTAKREEFKQILKIVK